MGKIIFILFVITNIIFALESNDTKIINNEIISNKKNATINDIFTPAKISNTSFNSMIIGYQGLLKKYHTINEWRYGIFFGLETGWIYLNDLLLFSINIDGTAGGFYSLNGNLKLGIRILNGRLIPGFSLGYGMINHIMENKQYNVHGSNGIISLFIDIRHGVGLDFAYRFNLYPFRDFNGIKIDDIKSFMINIKFINF